MTLYTIYLNIITLLKILFVGVVVIDYIIPNEFTSIWQGYIHTFINLLIALLLIYIFAPSSNKHIDKETKYVLYIFGITSIIHTILYSNL